MKKKQKTNSNMWEIYILLLLFYSDGPEQQHQNDV